MNHTAPQLAFINSTASLVIAISGPGSGKTQTVSDRIKRIVNDGCPASEIVALTFTNEAARQLQERIGFPLGYCGTLHGWIFRLLRRHGQLIGLAKDLTILDEVEAEAFLEETLRTSGLGNVPMKDLRPLLAKGPDKGRNDKVGLAVQGYYQKLRETGTVDYDAMLVFGVQLIQAIAKMEITLFGKDGKGCAVGTHLFVDEVQDSGDLDFSIYKSAPFHFKSLVGDGDQAIFGFRRGNPQHLLNALQLPGVEVHCLETNFRSDLEICDAAQALIEHNKQRFAKKTISASEELGWIQFPEPFSTAAQESFWLTKAIFECAKMGRNLNEIAVLCRTNVLVDHFKQVLAGAGIQVSKRETPVQPQDWQKCRLLLSWLCNPENDFLARKVVEMVEGKHVAASKAQEVAFAFSSINQTHFQQAIPVGKDVVATLRKYGVSEESLAVIGKVLETFVSNDEDYSIHDLAFTVAREQQSEKRGDGVSCLTIHSAKGLEWDTVFLPAFEEETIPGTRKDVNIEEERRLAFVAVTRARHQLYVSSAGQRPNPYGRGVLPRTPSRYIAELKGK